MKARKARRISAAVLLLVMLALNSMAYTTKAAKYEKSTGVNEDYLATDAKVPKLSAQAAIVMDARTGEILFQKNATKKEYPASITKCMTSLVAIEHNSENLNDVIKYSANAVFNVEAGSSGIAADVNEKFTVDQSLYAAMLESANESCNALAEKTAGSVDEFVKLMNQKAQQLGCVNTHFNNANGLYDNDHYTCPYDMALIVKDGLKNPNWRRYSGTVSYQCPPTNKKKETRYWNNHHKLLNGNIPYNSNLYTVEGGKTGYTVKCKNTLVTYAKSNTDDLELICVLMRSNKYYYVHGRSAAYTYEDTKHLLDWAFSNYSTISSSVEPTPQDYAQMDYAKQTYQMLQPKRLIDFKAENDCKIAVANTYDASKLRGKIKLDGNGENGKWGTYEFESGGKVISSTNVYYSTNQDAVKELYKKTNKIVNVSMVSDQIIYIIVAIVILLLLVVILRLLIVKIKNRKRSRGYGTLGGRSSHKRMKRQRRRMNRKVNYGYIDKNSRRRRKRYAKKKKLHF